MTREIEARLKLTAMDRTANAFKSVSGRMAAIDAKAKAMTAASSRMSATTAAIVARTAGATAGALAPLAVAGAAAKSFAHFAEVDLRLRRIGLTADASREQVAGVGSILYDLAQQTATPIDQVTSGLEDLVSQGKNLSEALAFLPSVVRTAAASGAEVKDMAASTGALADSLRISSGEMQGAFDILVAGGKAGKFELKDMSQYLPSLAPMAAAVGLKGAEGLKRLTAMLQIVRNQTGTASEAATNLTNVFAKMESEETAKKFAKFGVDLRKEMVKARKEGKELTEVFLDLSEKALKGDLSKVPQLFSDMQVAGGMRALLSQRDALRKLQATLDNVNGATLRDFGEVANTAAASITKLTTAWDRFVTNLGRTVSNAGVPGILDQISAFMDSRARITEAEAREPGGGKKEWIRQQVENGMDEDVAEELAYGWRQSRKAKAEDAPKAQAAVDRRVAAARAEMERLKRIAASDTPDDTGRMILQRQYDAAKAIVDAAPRDYGQRYAPPVDRARLAAAEAQRFRPGPPPPLPIPRRRPDIEAEAARPKPVDIPAKLDDREIEGEMQRLRARLQADLDSHPLVLRTRVDPARAPLDTGRSFKNGEFSGAP